LRAGFFFLLLLAMTACQKNEPAIPREKARELANVFYNRDLYKQAVAEYERYLYNYDLDEREQANITNVIAGIYFERLRDYENALAYYLRLRELYPKSELVADADKRVVECLERLQRSADAQQALAESAFLDTAQVAKKRPGEVIAKIGNREITQGDLDFELKQLPPYMQSQFGDRAKRLEFLRQFVATELMFDTAKRKGLDQDKEVVEAAFQAKKNFMVQKLAQEEIMADFKVEPQDVELYYKAHLDKYAEKDKDGKSKQRSFEEVKEQVAQDFVREKQQQKYNELVDRMMRAEKVEIFSDKVK
jgi:tetratricopeptide (TPR) repeat protein